MCLCVLVCVYVCVLKTLGRPWKGCEPSLHPDEALAAEPIPDNHCHINGPTYHFTTNLWRDTKPTKTPCLWGENSGFFLEWN